MSHAYYTDLWLITRNDLDKLIELDRKLQQQTRTSRKQHGLNLLLPTYLRYRNLVKRLIVCHDQMIQTQKRDLIKRVLDCTVGRMLEYKKEIVNLDFSDYQWPDDFMTQLKYTPDDVGILVSALSKDVMEQRRERIQKLMEDAYKITKEIESKELSVMEITEASESQESAIRLRRRRVREIISEPLPVQERILTSREIAEEAMRAAILLIQSHERARIGRCAGIDAQRMYNYNKKVQMGFIVVKKLHKSTYENAAKTIQQTWRIHAARKKMKNRIERTEELLGMTIPSWKSQDVIKKDRKNFQKKLTLMPGFANEIMKMTEKQQARLWKIRGPGLMEDITDEIREWFIMWYNDVGHFDAYPVAYLGGSVLITTGQTLTPQEYLVEKMIKQTTKAPIITRAKIKKKKQPWIRQTKTFSLLNEANQDFTNNWSFRHRTNEYREEIYHDLIKDKLCYELQLEMRKIVDELMRLELKKLNAALMKDYKADKRTLVIPIEKKRRAKKEKKERVPMSDESVENNFKELVRANIIKDYPKTFLKDWIGDLSYQNYEAAREARNYNHRMGEIRQIVMDYCVLPLSSREIHQVAPLIRAVGALLFDMTPTVLVDKYMGQKNERKLINMISEIARAYAPSVIFIDNSEKLWSKTLSEEDRHLKPKRFARYYPRLVKSIKRGDQILFLTISSEPYKATRPFIRIHDKFIMIPLTDYNTLYMFYKDLLMKYHGVNRDIDISTMAKMSMGIPLEFIKNTVDNVLNLRRRISLKFKPLAVSEIMDEVLKYEPPRAKTFSELVKFENRTPLAKKRARLRK
ncbi:Putative IQ and AAA domain-containing protein 1-like [Melipona quadrifasciata]|uniref:Putative IQ and AAA domain-containing protein 1-like n=1 Tax=Melipona quadrifasciata TaxID=166423 RepID=A0A0N1ITK1_9HYME|nr:Putative IQ and AAA domain-containing protein 1-like [Melipona quadrifasciata]